MKLYSFAQKIGKPRWKAYACLLAFVPQVVFYFACQHFGLTYHTVACELDSKIPFLPVFILAYASWALYVPGILFYCATVDPEKFLRRFWWFYSGIVFCSACFVIYPTTVPFRPEKAEGFFGALCNIAYANDNPVNAFPSLHCYEALSAHILAFVYGPLAKKKWLRLSSGILVMLICMSTVFVKQHSILDVYGGIGLALIIWLIYLLTSLIKRRSRENT